MAWGKSLSDACTWVAAETSSLAHWSKGSRTLQEGRATAGQPPPRRSLRRRCLHALPPLGCRTLPCSHFPHFLYSAHFHHFHKGATLLRAKRRSEAWCGGAGSRPFCQRPRPSVCRGAGLSHATRSSRREQPSELRRNICDSAVIGAKGVGIRGAAGLHHRQLPRLPPPLSHATKE